MSEPHLIVRAVSKQYEESVQVLSDLNFAAERGQRIALLGRSGSGKTTLLNLIAGIDELDAGEVIVAGHALAGLSDANRTLFRRRHIGFIYQTFNLIESLTATENIELPLQLNGFNREQRNLLTGEWLQRIGLQARASAYPDQLSGGEQQRVAIARAMIHSPALVLADEHTGNLDARSAQRVAELFDQMARQHQQTVLMVTHSQRVADSADRVLTLRDGCLQQQASGFAW